MTKNLKKALRLLRSGHPITEARFPTNYERAMTKVYEPEKPFDKLVKDLSNPEAYNAEFNIVSKEHGEQPLTEVEFHNEHSVEKLEE